MDEKSNTPKSGNSTKNIWSTVLDLIDPCLLQMNTFKGWKDCEQPIPIEEQACNIPKVCKLASRELRKQRYLYTCKECPETYPWIKNEFGMDFRKK